MDQNFIESIQRQCEALNSPKPNFIVNVNRERNMRFSTISAKINSVFEMNLECDDTSYRLPMVILDAIFFTINKFKTITALSLMNCRIRADGIERIARSISETGYVNDINLDMNPNSSRNHHLLCRRECKLQYLSLKFCDLRDSGAEKISTELKYRDNCDPSVMVALNLAHNKISDIGATFIAKQMLHTNRSIQSLNLSGNWITDTGALSILSELYMFPLTHEEIVELRKRKYARLMQQKEKLEVSSAWTLNGKQGGVNGSPATKEVDVEGPSGSKNRNSTSSKSSGIPQYKSSRIFDSPELDLHPFTTESYPVKGKIMSTGNLEPQHLNLSCKFRVIVLNISGKLWRERKDYELADNHLSRRTLEQMIKCVYYHSYMMLNDHTRGLLRINLEGNDIPMDDELWEHLYNLLDRRYKSVDDEPERYEALVPVESKILRSQITVQSNEE